MDERSCLDLSMYRFDKALTTLRTARANLNDAGDPDSSVNRSYYAVFYAMLSVTALDGFESNKHSEVISYFSQKYVKTGIFSTEISEMPAHASKLKECAEEQIQNAESVLSMIRPYLINRRAELEDKQ
ncbi:MAG: HEPN domain-containing protein [Synergistaceae bacterium]|nr:HEPN domain-containing protein [Synergistaceae bacterium]